MSLRAIVCVALPLAAALAACGPSQRPVSLTERDTIAACRQHANDVYDRLNRGEIYSSNQDTLAPNSSTGLLGNPTGGLSQRYAHDRMVASCVRDTGAGSNIPGSLPPLSVSPSRRSSPTTQ